MNSETRGPTHRVQLRPLRTSGSGSIMRPMSTTLSTGVTGLDAKAAVSAIVAIPRCFILASVTLQHNDCLSRCLPNCFGDSPMAEPGHGREIGVRGVIEGK